MDKDLLKLIRTVSICLLLLYSSFINVNGQPTGANCFDANPFCSTQNYNFQNNNAANNNLGPAAPAGPNYGCLTTRPRPVWYYLQIGQTGPISLGLSQSTGPNGTGLGIDVDFAMWGPFNDITAGCNAIMGGGLPPIQCSYSPAPNETIGIGAPGGFGAGASTPPIPAVGQIYIVLLTNFSNQAGFISLNQTNQGQPGAGATDCGILSAIQNNGPLCIGETLVLTANNVLNATSWTWTGPNGFSSNQQNPPPIPNVTPANAGVYSMTVTTVGSTATYTTTVVVNTPPDVNITKNDATCGLNNGSATANASGGTPPFLYQWSPSGGNGMVATGLSSGSYTVVVTDNNGCKDTASVIIDSIPSFTLSVLNVFDDKCGLGQGAAQILASGGSGNYTYSWTGSNSTSSSVTGLYGGTYICTVNDGVCTENISVTINGVAPLDARIVMNKDKFCQTLGLATVAVEGGTTPYSYLWTNNNQIDTILTNTNPNLLAGDNSVLVTDSNGCVFKVDFITNESPDTMIVTSSTVAASCNLSDGEITLNVTGGVQPYFYFWSTADTNSCVCEPGNNTLDSIPSGYYTALVIDGNQCEKYHTVFVNQPLVPIAGFSIDSTLIQKGEPTFWIIDQSENAESRYYIFNDGTESRFDNSGSFEHTYNGLNDFLFCITQTVQKDNCYDTLTNCVNVTGAFTMFIPNTFTPDNDKLNEVFSPKGRSVQSFSMVIFDRWGAREVFRTDNMEEGWNGTLNNSGDKYLPQGVYSYRIDVKSRTGKEYTYMGNINLLR